MRDRVDSWHAVKAFQPWPTDLLIDCNPDSAYPLIHRPWKQGLPFVHHTFPSLLTYIWGNRQLTKLEGIQCSLQIVHWHLVTWVVRCAQSACVSHLRPPSRPKPWQQPRLAPPPPPPSSPLSCPLPPPAWGQAGLRMSLSCLSHHSPSWAGWITEMTSCTFHKFVSRYLRGSPP